MKGALIIMLTFAFAAVKDPSAAEKDNPVIVIKTNKGVIEAELFKDKAPISVENVIQYIKSKYYHGTVFHRVIPNFMIQGGGFDANLKQKATRAPIKRGRKRPEERTGHPGHGSHVGSRLGHLAIFH